MDGERATRARSRDPDADDEMLTWPIRRISVCSVFVLLVGVVLVTAGQGIPPALPVLPLDASRQDTVPGLPAPWLATCDCLLPDCTNVIH